MGCVLWGCGSRVSAYVEHAVESQLTAEESFDCMLSDMLDATGGAPTDEERLTA